MHVGDQVLSINEVSLMSPRTNTNEVPNLNDANNLLAGIDKDQLKIEILPAKRINQLALLSSGKFLRKMQKRVFIYCVLFNNCYLLRNRFSSVPIPRVFV